MGKNYVAAIAACPFRDYAVESHILFFDEHPTEETVKLKLAESFLLEDYPGTTLEEALAAACSEDEWEDMEGYIDGLFGDEDEYDISIMKVPTE